MNQQKAEQQAREICHSKNFSWRKLEHEMATALLAAYEAGKKEQADRVKELESVIREQVEDAKKAVSPSSRMLNYEKAQAILVKGGE